MDEIEISRDDVVNSNLRVFLPYIIHCVPATQLLTHLTYYDKAQRKNIFSVSCIKPHEATRLALQILLDATDRQGLFIALLEALITAGYPKLVNILSGKYVPNDQYDEKVLQIFTPTIIQQLYPTEILPFLIKYGVLGEEEKEDICAEEKNHGSMRASYLLLSYLPCREEDWFRYFIQALIDSQHEHLASEIEPDLFTKIMAQKVDEEKTRKPMSDFTDIQENILTVEEVGNVDKHNGSMNNCDIQDGTSGLDLNELLEEDTSDTHKKEKGKCALKDEDETEVESLTNLKVNAIDGFIKYDRLFLLSLQWSPLANYVPTQVMRHPEISLTWRELQETGITGDIYGGARPKDRNVKYPRGERDETNENKDEQKGLDNLAKELDNLLLGDLTVNNGMNDLEVIETIYNRGDSFDELFDCLNIKTEMNDLDVTKTIYNREDSSEEELDAYNIKTDNDEEDGDEDKDIDLRDYQKELAKEGIEGENVIIMAPTNSGKTRVSMKIIQEHLRRQKREQKIACVIFLVQDEVLAIQQGKSFAEHLPAYRTKIISGTTQRDKKEFLKDFMDRRDILVVTAQVLINSLDKKEIRDLTRFTMMVFDECHHANKDHPYNQILSKYMDLKIVENVDMDELPQVVGMTASLGCGGNLKKDQAMEHMKTVMANMDAKCLCTVKRNIEELKKYVNPPIEEIRQVNKRTDNGFGNAISDIVARIVRLMKPHLVKIPGMLVPNDIGTEQFCQWLAEFVKAIAKTDGETARVLNPCRHNLEAYNLAILIYKDARVKDAMRIIDNCMRIFKLPEKKDATDNYLIDLYEGLKQKCFDNEADNPKLLEMQKIITEKLGRNMEARGIIFVKRKELAKALIAWMNDTEGLSGFHAEEFVGQSAAAYRGGSTKSRLTDVMEYFKSGRTRILVATSVLEEGIDITKCNLVIRYEHVTNEIVRLQSRGRARATDSKYFVLTEIGSWIVAKEERNAALETLMNKLVPELQIKIEDHQNLWEMEMRNIQQELKDKEMLSKRQREEAMTDTPISIQCFQCHTEICISTDIKKIQNCHHVIIGEEAAERFLFWSAPVPSFEDEELQYHGSICCTNCNYVLGGICEYRHAQFPLLKVTGFRDGYGKSYKKWKKVPFKMEQFTIEDLREVVEQRMNLHAEL